MVPELGRRRCPPLGLLGCEAGPSSLTGGNTGPRQTPASDRCPALQEGLSSPGPSLLCLRGQWCPPGMGWCPPGTPAPHQLGVRAVVGPWGGGGHLSPHNVFEFCRQAGLTRPSCDPTRLCCHRQPPSSGPCLIIQGLFSDWQAGRGKDSSGQVPLTVAEGTAFRQREQKHWRPEAEQL